MVEPRSLAPGGSVQAGLRDDSREVVEFLQVPTVIVGRSPVGVVTGPVALAGAVPGQTLTEVLGGGSHLPPGMRVNPGVFFGGPVARGGGGGLRFAPKDLPGYPPCPEVFNENYQKLPDVKKTGSGIDKAELRKWAQKKMRELDDLLGDLFKKAKDDKNSTEQEALGKKSSFLGMG